MHYLIDHWCMLWTWLVEGTNRATVILVFITGFYAILTWRMARAIARQTRAMIQPVALLEFHWEREKSYHPSAYFEIKNLGTQPLLLLDVKLWCGLFGGENNSHIIIPYGTNTSFHQGSLFALFSILSLALKPKNCRGILATYRTPFRLWPQT